MPTTKKTETVSPEQLENRAHALAAHGRELAIEAERLEREIRHARGTRDIPKPAKLIARLPEPDGISTSALYERVQQLVIARPMLFREIVDETKAGENRIKGVLVRLQRDGAGLVNLGNGRTARWFIPSEALLKKLRSRR